MAEENTTQVIADEPSRSPLILILALAACVGVAAFSFYLGLQKSAIVEQQKQLDTEIMSLQGQIDALEEEKVEAAQQAQQWLDAIEKDEVRWSGVITRINSLIPLDALSREYKVKFLSYSGSQGGKLTLNGQTREMDTDPYPDVAELIEVFNDSSYFSKAYVPSVTRGETDQGKKVASFIFSILYREEAPDINAQDSLLPTDLGSATDVGSQETVEVAQPKVSRQ